MPYPVNDILWDFEDQNAVALIALDLSAAFDTVVMMCFWMCCQRDLVRKYITGLVHII